MSDMDSVEDDDVPPVDHAAGNRGLRERSGEVSGIDVLQGVLYDLLRDHIQPSTLEKIVRDNSRMHGNVALYTNGWLASYAEDLAKRIRGEI